MAPSHGPLSGGSRRPATSVSRFRAAALTAWFGAAGLLLASCSGAGDGGTGGTQALGGSGSAARSSTGGSGAGGASGKGGSGSGGISGTGGSASGGISGSGGSASGGGSGTGGSGGFGGAAGHGGAGGAAGAPGSGGSSATGGAVGSGGTTGTGGAGGRRRCRQRDPLCLADRQRLEPGHDGAAAADRGQGARPRARNDRRHDGRHHGLPARRHLPADQHAGVHQRRLGPERPLRQVPGLHGRAADHHGRTAHHRLDGIQRGNGIYTASGITTPFRQLYVNGVKAIRARTPNLGSNGAFAFNRLTGADNTNAEHPGRELRGLELEQLHQGRDARHDRLGRQHPPPRLATRRRAAPPISRSRAPRAPSCSCGRSRTSAGSSAGSPSTATTSRTRSSSSTSPASGTSTRARASSPTSRARART